MQTIAADSLLNEAGFLAELETLDEGIVRKPRTPVANDAYEPLPDLPVPVRTSPHGKFVESAGDVADEATDGVSLAGRLAAVAMFVLMMGVGAAGAVVVFHTQVARILATW